MKLRQLIKTTMLYWYVLISSSIIGKESSTVIITIVNSGGVNWELYTIFLRLLNL